MKTIIEKKRWLPFALLLGFVFSSFTMRKTEEHMHGGKSELDKVTKYTNMMICTPIRMRLEKGITKDLFSRCWSGYTTEFQSAETVKTNCFVYGTIHYSAGCSPSEYICDFKICVDKGYAAVRSRKSDDFISVDEWLKIKQWEKSEHKHIPISKNNR